MSPKTPLRPIVAVEYGWDRVEPDGSVTNGDLHVDDDGVVRWVPAVAPPADRPAP